MKRTQRKDALRNIRKRIASYLSVCLVIVLGIGGMLTTQYMEAGLDRTASKYYEDHKFKNYELISSLGISEANIKKIGETDHVISAEGVLQVDGSATFDGRKDNVVVISLTKDVSVPEVVEGREPEAANECSVGEDFAEMDNIKIGDKLHLSVSNIDMSSADALGSDGEDIFAELQSVAATTEGDEEEQKEQEEKDKENREEMQESINTALVEKEFTVTGLVRHPDFLRRKAVNAVVLPLSAFNKKATKGLYTQAYVRTEEPQGLSPFSDKYFEKNEGIKKSLEKLSEQLKEDRSKEVRDEANSRIDKEWSKAEEKLDEGQEQIDSGEEELNARLSEGRQKLYDAEKMLEDMVDEYTRKLKNGEITVPEYNKTIKELENDLKTAKESLKTAEELFSTELTWTDTLSENTDKLLKNMPKEGSPTTAEELEIANTVLENELSIREYLEVAGSDEALEAIKELSKYTDKDLKKYHEDIKALDADFLVEESQKVKDSAENGSDGGTYHYKKDLLTKLKKALEAIDAAKEAVENGKKQVESAEKKLEKGKKQAKERIESEAAKGRQKIEEGWAKYYSEKEKYESKLEEAKELLSENREKAEEKLGEAKEKVEDISCEWIVLDRRGNAGYMDMMSNLLAIKSMGLVFGLLFAIITAIVCFSTLVIMIDEQKTLVGTCKAFGFHKREVLGKYMVFGLSSAVVGSVFAAIAAYILTFAIQNKLGSSGMYSIGVAESPIVIKPTVLAVLMISAVTVAATVIACLDILRSPASLLMKGGVLRKTTRKKKSSSRKGSLYSKLIIRNMIDDKARVLVSIAIIGFSCLLIGLGISMKAAFDGMVNRQISDVNRYDLRIDLNDEADEKDRAAIVDTLKRNSLSYLPATVEMRMYVWDNKVDGLQMICADADKISEFYGIVAPKKGRDMTLPKDGVLIQKRMHESYNMNIGDKLPLLGSDLSISELEIKGYFLNYAGRAIVLTPEAYKKAFGIDAENRSYFVNLGEKDRTDIEKQLLAVTDDISIAEDDEFKTQYESAMSLYNLLVIVTTAIAIFISFMILTNLANIYLARKKTELSVMRVNGFSIGQTKAYLVRESIFTTAAGIALGVGVGAVLTPLLIQSMQQPDLEFIKSFQPVAWTAAAGIEAVFAILINYVVFRKVKDLNLRDIAG